MSKPLPPVFLSLDVEADGPSPSTGSMISFALVDTTDTSRHFYAELHPVHIDVYVPGALAVSGFTRAQTLAFEDPAVVMQRCAVWISKTYGAQRCIVISDNPAFDWQFFNDYCRRFLAGTNPCGHSARRIGDVWAGLQGNTRDDSAWKRWRTGKHTHNALDDAIGNADAWMKIQAEMARRRSQRASNNTAPSQKPT